MTNNLMEMRQMTDLNRNLQSVAGALIVATALLASASCSRGEAAAVSDDQLADQANVRVVNVETKSVSLGEFRGFIRVTGEVEAMYDVTISAEESGRIERFLAEKGQRVRRGQALAQLESDLLSA